MTREEVLEGLQKSAQYWEARYKHDRNDLKGGDLYFMNVAAEAAVLLMDAAAEEDDRK